MLILGGWDESKKHGRKEEREEQEHCPSVLGCLSRDRPGKHHSFSSAVMPTSKKRSIAMDLKKTGLNPPEATCLEEVMTFSREMRKGMGIMLGHEKVFC